MDVTMAPCEKMEMSMGRVEPASSLSKTVVGGGMDITMDPITALNSTGKELMSEEGTVINGDYTRHGGGMEATLVSSQTDLLPDSLPNSNNSSFDGGATATVKFSQLALANNTLMLPRYIHLKMLQPITVDIVHDTGRRVRRKTRRRISPGHLNRSLFCFLTIANNFFSESEQVVGFCLCS